MTDDRGAVKRTFRIGRYVCELTVPVMRGSGVGVVTVEWSPSVPVHLTDAERAAYAAELLAALADATEARP